MDVITKWWFTLWLCSFPSSRAPAAPTHLLVTRIGPCPDVTNTIVTISEMSIARKTYDFSVSGQLNISTNISNGWTIKATMRKCQDIRDTDTCDHLRAFTVISDGCSRDDHSDALDLYAMIFHYATPRLSCPIQEGTYKLEGYPFYTGDNYLSVSESKLSTSRFGYTFRLEGFAEHNLIMCVDAVMQLIYVREHDWISVRNYSTETEQNSKPNNKNVLHH